MSKIKRGDVGIAPYGRGLAILSLATLDSSFQKEPLEALMHCSFCPYPSSRFIRRRRRFGYGVLRNGAAEVTERIHTRQGVNGLLHFVRNDVLFIEFTISMQ